MMLHKYCFHIFEAPRLHRGGQGEELLWQTMQVIDLLGVYTMTFQVEETNSTLGRTVTKR